MILHCDLKPANILVFRTHSNDTTLKIADFGLAAGIPWPHYRPGGTCYTAEYRPPECVVSRTVHLQEKADVFALGCVAFDLFCDPESTGLLFPQVEAVHAEMRRVYDFDRPTAAWQVLHDARDTRLAARLHSDKDAKVLIQDMVRNLAGRANLPSVLLRLKCCLDAKARPSHS